MAVVKRILCLTNSRKPGGTCFAGRVLEGDRIGAWIRPVGERESEAVSTWEQRLPDGNIARPLDIVDVPLLNAKPHACQTENWLIDDLRRWARASRATEAQLAKCIENPANIWLNGHSTRHGYHDEMPQAESDRLTNSLVLVRVHGVRLRVLAPGIEYGNPERRVQGFFAHGGVKYGLRVTDLQIENEYLKRGNGFSDLGESCITISMSEPFRKSNGDAYRYKLIAAIIPLVGHEE